MNALTKSFAAENGYRGDSPALLGAFEVIRKSGIREARAAHYDRKKLVDQYKASPALFFAAIHPSLSTEEAIEDSKRFLAFYRSMPTWRQQNRAGDARRAKQAIVVARFFRRFGLRIWTKEAA
jgi:hypothetical protein